MKIKEQKHVTIVEIQLNLDLAVILNPDSSAIHFVCRIMTVRLSIKKNEFLEIVNGDMSSGLIGY